MAKRTPTLRLLIGDVKWRVRLLTTEQFAKEHGEEHKDSGALTDTSKNIVDFQIGEITKENVYHEMFHAYFTLALVNNAPMDRDQTEEVAATVMGKYATEYIANAYKTSAWLEEQLKSITSVE